MPPWPPWLCAGSCLQRREAARGPAQLGPVRLPLYHPKGAPNEGVFKVRLGLGDAVVDLIVDSCSADVIVVGEQCGDACQQTAGVYGALRPTFTGETGTVAYVSQSNRIAWARDAFSFPAASDGPGRPAGRALLFGVITANESHAVQGGALPGRSVLGLMAVQRPSAGPGLGLLDAGDERSFVNQVFGPGGVFQRAAYSIAIEPSGDSGELVLGGVHRGIKGWVPLVPAAEVPLLRHSPQWVVRVVQCQAVAHGGAVLLQLPLRYARFDTGNTWLSLPRWVFRRHGHLGELPDLAGLQFQLENDVTVWCPAPTFSGSIAMANATGFGGLAEDPSLPHDWLIFGNEIMKGMTVACDLERAMLGFGGMCTAVGNPNLMDCERYTPPELEPA
eukprot:EG_transcript_11807